MPKIDRIVKKETGFIALVTLLFSAVMQVVFFLLDRWNATVLFGNLLGGSLAVLNFFLRITRPRFEKRAISVLVPPISILKYIP